MRDGDRERERDIERQRDTLREGEKKRERDRERERGSLGLSLQRVHWADSFGQRSPNTPGSVNKNSGT